MLAAKYDRDRGYDRPREERSREARALLDAYRAAHGLDLTDEERRAWARRRRPSWADEA